MFINFSRKCETCEVLKDELREERTEKNRLLNKILELQSGKHIEEPQKQEAQQVTGQEELKRPRVVMSQKEWLIKRQELEAQDRVLAASLREEEERRIASLEKEAGIADAAK